MKPLTMSAEQEKRDREKLTWTVNLNDRVTFELLGALMRGYRELDATRASLDGCRSAWTAGQIENSKLADALSSEIVHADRLEDGLHANIIEKATLQMAHAARRYKTLGGMLPLEELERGRLVVRTAGKLARVAELEQELADEKLISARAARHANEATS